MNEAWTKFLKGLGNAQETEQPEYTWGRVVKHEDREDNAIDRSGPGSSAIQEGDTASWTYEVLDVVGTNVDSYDQIAHQAMVKRCDDVPHPPHRTIGPCLWSGDLWSADNTRESEHGPPMYW